MGDESKYPLFRDHPKLMAIARLNECSKGVQIGFLLDTLHEAADALESVVKPCIYPWDERWCHSWHKIKEAEAKEALKKMRGGD